MSSPDLYVAWQDSVKRGIYPVARLRVHEGEHAPYEFRYIRGALAAQSHGFVPFDSFPRLTETYLGSELFPFFRNRVMPTGRPDYAGYVHELGLCVEDADPVTLLSRSGGVRATDHLEIYAAPRDDEGCSCWHFLVRGVRHLPQAEARIDRLEPGERLYAMRDVQNPFNARALLLRSEDKINLGYVPDLLVDDLAELDFSPDAFEVTVARVNSHPAPVRHRILCQLKTRWPPSRRPFASPRFEPLDPESAS